jgi:hypothetical protein
MVLTGYAKGKPLGRYCLRRNRLRRNAGDRMLFNAIYHCRATEGRQAVQQRLVRHQGLAGGWSTATTADRTRANAAGVRTPTERTISPVWAVNSLPGRAKLATRSPPDAKSEASSGTAAGSPYGLL